MGLDLLDGVESTWWDVNPAVTRRGVRHIPPARRAPLMVRLQRRKWRNIVERHFGSAEVPASNPFGWGDPSMLEGLDTPNVWNLHWVSWFLDWKRMLPAMADLAPIVWTLHDLNPLSGMLHYDSAAGSDGRRERFEEQAREMKQSWLAAIPRDRIVFVGPSQWMVDRCRQSTITSDFSVERIPYGVDTNTYTPRNRSIWREILGISDESVVLGIAAADLEDPRKGMKPLQDAMRIVREGHREVCLITVGEGKADPAFPERWSCGAVNSDCLLSYFYSACDLFICPSLQDNLPNTVLESMACGTPVIAYRVGGLPDMVREGESGQLVNDVGSAEALAHAISALVESRKDREMRASTRALAVREFALDVQAKRYRDLWRDRSWMG